MLVEQQVGGLDVAVQHATRVRVLERGRDVAPYSGRLRDRELRAPVEHAAQASALEQLEDHERHVVLTPVVHGHDVRVVQ